jgi:hypothetical protein
MFFVIYTSMSASGRASSIIVANYSGDSNNSNTYFPCKLYITNYSWHYNNHNNRSSCILGLSANEKVHLACKADLARLL